MFEALRRAGRRLSAWLHEEITTRRDRQEPEGFLASTAGRLTDGVTYTLPVVVPQMVLDLARRGNDPSLVRAWLNEAYPQYKTQWSDPYYQHEPMRMLELAQPLKEWDFNTRVSVLEQTHLAWERNPLANAIVTWNRLFSVQNGMRRSYRSEVIREVVEAFCRNPENDIETAEKELMDTLQVDGEVFIEFHEGTGTEGGKGETVITYVPAWGIRAIETERGFVRRPLKYHPSYSQDTGIGTGGSEYRQEPIAADRIEHVAINKKVYEQRGRPELFKVLPYLGGYKEWLENRARQNAYRDSVVYDVTLKNATAAQVSAKRSQYKQPPQGASIAIHNDNEEWKVHSPSIDADSAAEDGRQIKLMVAAGARQPEYFFSDGSNANLASATAQQLPALLSFSDWQDINKKLWRRVFERVLIAAGHDLDNRIPEEEETKEGWQPTGRLITVREAFDIKYSELGQKDPKSIAEALAIASGQDWMSNETAANLLPFDLNYEAELRKMELEMERERDLIAQGLKMNPLAMQQSPFGGNGAGPQAAPAEDDDTQEDEDAPDNGKERDNREPARRAA